MTFPLGGAGLLLAGEAVYTPPTILGSYAASSTTGASITVSFTLPSGSDRIVIAVEGFEGANSGANATGCTYSGIAMTKAVDASQIVSSFMAGCSIWYLLEADLPADGAHDCVLSYPDAKTGGAIMGVYAIEGATEQSVEDTQSNTVSGNSLAITYAAQALSWGAIGAAHGDQVGAYSTPANWTAQQSSSTSGAKIFIAHKTGSLDLNESVTLTCTGASTRYALVGAAFR